MAVTGNYVRASLCAYAIVCPSRFMERDVEKMQEDENPIPSLMNDESGDSA
jgi:hypothetical protein